MNMLTKIQANFKIKRQSRTHMTYFNKRIKKGKVSFWHSKDN